MNRRRLFLFMLGQLGIMMLARFFFQWIMRFADTPVGNESLFAVSTVGSLLLGFRLFDGLTDPLAGMLSDWWVRQGKSRQNLLWLGFFLPPIGLMLCFSPTAAMASSFRWIILLLGFLLFFIGYTLYAIPYWSLIDDYARGDDHDRRALSNMLGLGLILATIVGFVVSPLLVEYQGFFGASMIFSVVALFFMLAPIFAAPEGAIVSSSDIAPKLSMFGSFIDALKDIKFLALLCLLAGSQMSFTVLTAAAPYIAVVLLGGADKDVSLLLGPLILSAVPMFYFAPKISARLGWEKSLLLASLALGLVYCAASAIGISMIYSPTVTAMIIFACGGPMIALLLAVEGEGIAACAQSRGGSAVSIYFGVFNLVVKALNGAALFLTGMLIEASKGDWAEGAVRFMVISAGLMLFVGVVLYFLLSKMTGPRSVH